MASERILIVDDEEAIREIVSSMLENAGYQAMQAASGVQALEILGSGEEFQLMLSDLMMAEMDGIALLDRVQDCYPDMPAIMVTAVHDISVALAAIRNGAYDYLLKPFEREQLLAMVRRALEHRKLRLENRAYQSNLESLVAARTEQLRQTMADLERSYDITLEALGDALDLKDAETEGHSKRVTAFTIAMARAMGMSGDKIRIIARGAFLHDIGKMAIPDAILRKPGALTEEEVMIMREHCARGYHMLKKIPFLADASEIVYSHQEKYDGTGYPRGLVGDEIPIGSRLFAVADTLDAITSDRPYRAAQTVQAAREEIKRFSGTQFDPKVVEIFLSMPDSIWEDLRREINSHARKFAFPSKFAERNA
ncbi:MAG: response regulator [Acidobacteria bacterium]|nr:response regulator [Acidobacteriota bacterium]MBV9145499.1 response regulator [Acidobacteriota bacterium]MBV9435910.1 response regulator [Acidobacteriota bacterium]